MTLPLVGSAALPAPPEASRREFWLLVGSVVALFTFADIARRTTLGTSSLLFTDGRLLATLAIEGVLTLLWLPYLSRRGWRLAHVTRPLGRADILHAIGLAVAAYLTYGIASALVTFLDPGFVLATIRNMPPRGVPSPGAIAAISVLNPIFEEFLYLGYVANALRATGPGPSLMAVIALRLALHLYQGTLAFLTILPVAVVFSLYYLRTGRLWPVIGAHAVLDAVSLTMLARAADDVQRIPMPIDAV